MNERIEAYLTFLADEEGYSDNTVAAYRNDLHQFLNWLGDQSSAVGDWCDLTRREIADYLFYLRERQYATSTIARKMAAIKRFCVHLMDREELTGDPMSDVTTPKVKKHTPQGLSRDSIQRLLQQPVEQGGIKGLRDRAMLELLYGTGMRVSELVNLKVGDLNLEGWTVLCGSGQNQRTLPVSPRAMGALNDYINDGRRFLTSNEEDRILFLNMRGGQLTRQGLWLIIKHYVESAGIRSDVTPHTLRHSFAIHRLSEGSELSEVQGLLGHANISTTQVYIQAREESVG